MRGLHRVLFGLGAAAVVAGAACVITVWWEGSEASVSFSWSVNGSPAATACGPAGAARVRMWISQYEPSCELSNRSCGTWDGAWEWDCTAGTGSTGMRFAAVGMYMGWTLLDASGNVLSYTPWTRYDLHAGENTLGEIPFTVGVATDAAVVSDWTINGEAASAASCSASGGERVYLTWRATGTTDERSMYWQCTDPSGTTGAVFVGGTSYDLRWELKDGTGATISAAPGPDTWRTETLVAGNNTYTVAFVTAATADAEITATWTINGAAADADSCGAANAMRAYVTWRAAGTTDERSMYWDCSTATGATGTEFVSGQAYELRWELRTADETVLSAAPDLTSWQELTPVAGSNPVSVAFEVAVGRLDVTLEWADKVTSPAYGSCTLPPQDVAVMGYLLETSTGTVVDEVDIDTASIECRTDLAWIGAPFDTYSLAVDGRAASPATAVWAGTCPDLVVDELLTNAFTCQVPMTTP